MAIPPAVRVGAGGGGLRGSEPEHRPGHSRHGRGFDPKDGRVNRDSGWRESHAGRVDGPGAWKTPITLGVALLETGFRDAEFFVPCRRRRGLMETIARSGRARFFTSLPRLRPSPGRRPNPTREKAIPGRSVRWSRRPRSGDPEARRGGRRCRARRLPRPTSR